LYFLAKKNVKTIAFGLDFETDFLISNNFNSNITLTIQNIESFYNYRTIGNNFQLVTSVLSGENEFIELKLRLNTDSLISHKDYIVIPENKLIETDVNIMNLKIKQTRINSALMKIRNNLEKNNLNTENEFFSYFSKVANESNVINLIKIKPPFCNLKKTAKKSICNNCEEICSLTMEMILHPTKPVSQSDINEELMIHHHPSSRIIKENNGKNRSRTTKEAAEELASHYIYAHNKKRPEFI
jgi:hypothetical protein